MTCSVPLQTYWYLYLEIKLAHHYGKMEVSCNDAVVEQVGLGSPFVGIYVTKCYWA